MAVRDMNRNNKQKSEWEEKVISIRRVAKVTTGGKRFRFSATVVVGNGKGKIGIGYGKANEIADAIKKAKDKAIKEAKAITMKGTTIPHNILGKFKCGEVLMKPASKGTGVIAGGTVRSVVELAGIKDILTKSMRSSNKVNIAKATINGLSSLMNVEDVSKRRGISISDVYGSEAKNDPEEK